METVAGHGSSRGGTLALRSSTRSALSSLPSFGADEMQTCVRRRAILSVAANPNCKSKEDAERAVNEVWESCFADTRPFDEVRLSPLLELVEETDGVCRSIEKEAASHTYRTYCKQLPSPILLAPNPFRTQYIACDSTSDQHSCCTPPTPQT